MCWETWTKLKSRFYKNSKNSRKMLKKWNKCKKHWLKKE